MTSEQTSTRAPSASAIPLPLPVKGELGRRSGSGLHNGFVFLCCRSWFAVSKLQNSCHKNFKHLVNVLVLLGRRLEPKMGMKNEVSLGGWVLLL